MIVQSATDLLSTSTVVFELLSTIFVVAACVRNMRSLQGLKMQKNGLIMLMFRQGELAPMLHSPSDLMSDRCCIYGVRLPNLFQ